MQTKLDVILCTVQKYIYLGFSASLNAPSGFNIVVLSVVSMGKI